MKCDVVLDLVPIYHDGIASEVTKGEIRQHLRTCADCRAYYQAYAQSMKVQTQTGDGQPSGDALFDALSRRMRRRHLLSTASMIAVVAVTICGTLLSVAKWLEDDASGSQSSN